MEAQAFVAEETGKYRVTVGEEVGGGELGKQVVQYIADSVTTCHMTPDTDGLTNYRECSRPLDLPNGGTTSIAGYGDLTVAFRSDNGWVRVKLHDVAHAPLLSYNLISLPSLALKGHTYAGDKDGVTLKLKGRKTVHFPLIGKLCRQYGYRPEAKGRVVDTACVEIASGQAKAPTTPTDINTSHCTYGHTHEVLLKKPAEQQGVNLSGKLHEYRGCSMVKGLWNPIARSTHTRADTFCPSRVPAATAPYCRREGVYSGGGRHRRGGVTSRRREDVRLGQRVQPRHHDGGVAPGATRNARGASGRTWSRGREGASGNPTTTSVSPGRSDFRGINGSGSSDDSRTSSESNNSNDSGDLPALVGRPARDLEVFGELSALQSGRTRSQSRGLTMSASYADVLSAYAMRAVVVNKTMEKKATEIERAHDSLLEERLEKEREWLEELERCGAQLD